MDVRKHDGVEDLRAAYEAHDRAWRVGFRGIVPSDVVDAQLRSTDEEDLEALAEELAAEPGAFLVAEREDAVVGFVRARYGETADFVDGVGGEVVDLYVDPAHWRDGIGSSLLGSAVDRLPVMIDGISTRVLAENDRARSFLEANDLVHEETVEATVGGESFPHAIYRIGLDD